MLNRLDYFIGRQTRADFGYDLTREQGTSWDFTLYLGWYEVVISYTQQVPGAVPID